MNKPEPSLRFGNGDSFEKMYFNLVSAVAAYGNIAPSRVGETKSMFGTGLIIDSLLYGKFPILTTRQIFYKPIFGELAAFLRGATYVAEFQKFGCNYWNANAAAWHFNKNVPADKHMVGRIYGAQWRRWFGNPEDSEIDQIARLIKGLKDDPHGRRHVVSCWKPDEFEEMCLPPCHIFFQCYVNTARWGDNLDPHLEMVVYMRSVDLCLGLPTDIVLYAALLILLAKETGYQPGALKFMFGDAHVYQDHALPFMDQATRPVQELPKYALDVEATVDNFEPHHLELLEYTHAKPIAYPLHV